MTVRETAENIAKAIDSMAEEIAKRSVPSSECARKAGKG